MRLERVEQLADVRRPSPGRASPAAPARRRRQVVGVAGQDRLDGASASMTAVEADQVVDRARRGQLQHDRHVAAVDVEVDQAHAAAASSPGLTPRLVATRLLPTPPLVEKTVMTLPWGRPRRPGRPRPRRRGLGHGRVQPRPAPRPQCLGDRLGDAASPLDGRGDAGEVPASTTSRMPLRRASARVSLSTSCRSRITPRSGRCTRAHWAKLSRGVAVRRTGRSPRRTRGVLARGGPRARPCP